MKLSTLAVVAAAFALVAAPVATQAKTANHHKVMKHSRHIGSGGRMPASRNF